MKPFDISTFDIRRLLKKLGPKFKLLNCSGQEVNQGDP